MAFVVVNSVVERLLAMERVERRRRSRLRISSSTYFSGFQQELLGWSWLKTQLGVEACAVGGH
jgi:hypothetical protein